MKLLISGICGFVGSTLARTWINNETGHEIIGIDNLGRPGSERNRTDLSAIGVKLVHGDIRCTSDLDSLPDCDYVIDCAAMPSVLAGIDGQSSSQQLVEHNLNGCLNLLEYCKRRNAGFILLSTSRVYSIEPLAKLNFEVINNQFQPVFDKPLPNGLSPKGINEAFSTAPPVSLYGATKIASEVMALEYGATFNFPVWINRCGVLGGAGQFGHAEQGIFSYWIHAWRSSVPLKYIGFEGKGYQVRDVLSPVDLIPVLDQQMSFGGKLIDRTFNLAGGIENASSLFNLSAWCENRFGANRVTSQVLGRTFDLPWVVLDCSKAKDVWGWHPTTTIDMLLAEIADFAEANPNWLDIVKY